MAYFGPSQLSPVDLDRAIAGNRISGHTLDLLNLNMTYHCQNSDYSFKMVLTFSTTPIFVDI